MTNPKTRARDRPLPRAVVAVTFALVAVGTLVSARSLQAPSSSDQP